MFESTIVYSKAFGEGTILSIDSGKMNVLFKESNEIKTFVFPDSIGKFLTTESNELLLYAQETLEQKKKEQEAKAKLEEEKRNEKSVSIKSTWKNEGYQTPLLGNNAMDIFFHTKNDYYEVVGYLAKPNRVNSFQAEIPEGPKVKTFELLFPGQEYGLIRSSYGENGLITKQGCQFRINLNDISNCPETLFKNISEINGHWAGRINRSKFVLGLVQYHGFKFGRRQSLTQIEEMVPKEYYEDFTKGINR